MNVHLTGQSEKFVNDQLARGACRTPEEVIQRALEVLQAEEEWIEDHKDAIHAKIERAFGQFERGEFFTAEQSRADMEKHKAAWLSKTQR